MDSLNGQAMTYSHKTRNDAQLGEQLAVILRAHDDLNRMRRDNKLEDMWILLSQIRAASELGMYRIHDLVSMK